MDRYNLYKDSGIKWIGSYPKHWKKTKLKYYTEYLNGYAFKSEGYVENGIPVIRIGDIKPIMDLSASKKVPFNQLEELRPGTNQTDPGQPAEAWIHPEASDHGKEDLLPRSAIRLAHRASSRRHDD